MLAQQIDRVLNRLAPGYVPGSALHRRALAATAEGRYVDAEQLFEAAALEYRRELARRAAGPPARAPAARTRPGERRPGTGGRTHARHRARRSTAWTGSSLCARRSRSSMRARCSRSGWATLPTRSARPRRRERPDPGRVPGGTGARPRGHGYTAPAVAPPGARRPFTTSRKEVMTVDSITARRIERTGEILHAGSRRSRSRHRRPAGAWSTAS